MPYHINLSLRVLKGKYLASEERERDQDTQTHTHKHTDKEQEREKKRKTGVERERQHYAFKTYHLRYTCANNFVQDLPTHLL